MEGGNFLLDNQLDQKQKEFVEKGEGAQQEKPQFLAY
jgi:hypothetical protein